MEQPPKLVLDAVQRRWASVRSRGFFGKLIDLIIIRPVAIEIVQTSNLHERTHFCTGDTLNRWRYDDEGLRSISLDDDIGEERLDYCYYCVDREKKRLAIEWEKMLPDALRGSKIRYDHHHGVVYEIIEANGVESLKRTNVWMV